MRLQPLAVLYNIIYENLSYSAFSKHLMIYNLVVQTSPCVHKMALTNRDSDILVINQPCIPNFRFPSLRFLGVTKSSINNVLP